MKVAIVRADGNVSIMHLVEGADIGSEIEKIKPMLPEGYVSHHIIYEDLPQDRTFREAWKHDGFSLSIDMQKARYIWRGKLRELRAPKLASLDIEYQRADESGDVAAKARIVSRKQSLRDVTSDPRIDAAQTTDDLKAAMPEVLL